jgi:predicted lysophospholipase L1 biosynthesis ABC-type transport system permease subunit
MELNYNSASASYFAAMGIPLLRGRLFEPVDRTASPVALVNEAMAERYWGTHRAVGHQFRLGDSTEVTVVGVVGDAKYRNLREERRPSFYLSTDQSAPARATFHVSVEGDPVDLMETLRTAIAHEPPGILVTRLRTLRQQADLSLTDERVATVVGTATGGASALLASIVLFATFAYGVIRRRREIGLRLALGASPASVRFMILREAIVLVSISSIVGVGLGLVLGRYMQARLYGVDVLDPVSLLAPSVILTFAAIAASWWPARRASVIDPALTLRAD